MKKYYKPPPKNGIIKFDGIVKKFKQRIKKGLVVENRAVIYCRVAHTSQDTKSFGLDRQERVCKERCQNQSPPIPVEQVFIESGTSGAKTCRKGLDNCLAFLNQQNKKYNKITQFVVSDFSRISRSVDISEAFMIAASIKNTGVKIVSLDMLQKNESSNECNQFKPIPMLLQGIKERKSKESSTL